MTPAEAKRGLEDLRVLWEIPGGWPAEACGAYVRLLFKYAGKEKGK